MADTRKVLIERTHAKTKRKIIADGDIVLISGKDLTHAGLMVYLYFLTVVPDSYEGENNEGNTRNKYFEFSPQAMENYCGFNKRSAQRGFQNLIDNKFLELIDEEENLYQFVDNLEENKTLTPKESKKVIQYKERLSMQCEKLKNRRNEHLYEIAENQAQREQPQEQPRRHYDWE